MKILVPRYYKNFKCSADRCSDNCCIGWEICIDDATMEGYMSLEADKRKKILDTVDFDGGATFRLTSCERCANLDHRGLCKIISGLGEDYLCQICRDHPRYFNQTADGIEGGVGLACEEAARLILTSNNVTAMEIVNYADVTSRYVCEEALSLDVRGHIFAYLDGMNMCGEGAKVTINRLLKISALLDDTLLDNAFGDKNEGIDPSRILATEWNVECDPGIIVDLCDAFDDAEALQEDFHTKRKSAGEALLDREFYSFLDGEGRRYFSNLLSYFIHRYFLTDEASHLQSMGFAIASAVLISAMVYVSGSLTVENFILEAKGFSKNIEYSEENVEKALEHMVEIPDF